MSRKMKESGIAWIGEIPSEWEIAKIKNVADQNDEKYTSGSYDYIALENVESITSKLIQTESVYSLYGNKMANEGDVIFGKLRPYLRKVMKVGKSVCVSNEFIVYKPKSVTGDFLKYYLLSDGFISAVNASTYGAKMPRANSSFVDNCEIVFPKMNVQKKIAKYLDKKCSQIDALISNQQKQIEKLKQYKQSIITEVVTKGLNPDAEMKDSGVAWIGEISQNHFVERLKFSLLSPMMYGANSSGTQNKDNAVRYIRITDITLDSKLKDDENNLYLPLNDAESYLLNDGDVLFARSGGTVGKSFIYHSRYGRSAFAGYLIKAECDKKKLLPEFLFYYTQSSLYEKWKNMIFIQATIQNIGASKYSNMELVLMSVKEQEKIVAYLDKKCSNIEKLIAIKQQKIEKLNQYKKSVIYEYVTGKKEA